MLDNLNQYERVFNGYLRAQSISACSLNTPEWKSRAKRHDLKTPDFRFEYEGTTFICDVKGSASQDNWMLLADVEQLQRWQQIFRDRTRSLFVFVHRIKDGSPSL